MTRDERIILRLEREVEDLRGELRDTKKQMVYVEAARRDRTLMEALDTLDDAVKRAESAGIEIGIKAARMAVRTLMDRQMPLMVHPSEQQASAA